MGDIVRILVIVLAAPIWWPVAKAMWAELNEGLASEGGLFGTGEVRQTARHEGLGWQSMPRGVQQLGRLGRRPLPAGGRRAGARRRLPSSRWN